LAGFWQNCHLLPPSLDSEQRGRGWENRAAAGRGGAGGPVHGGGRGMGQNGEEVEGNRFPCSPCAMAACRGGSAGGADWRRRRSGVQEGGGSVVAVRGEPGSCRPLFISAERRFGRLIFSSFWSSCGRQWCFGKGPGVDLADGIRGQSGTVRRDPSCRWRAGRGDAKRMALAVVLEGMARAGAFKAAAALGRQGGDPQRQGHLGGYPQRRLRQPRVFSHAGQQDFPTSFLLAHNIGRCRGTR
jgi:hypothetical protein